MTVQELIDELSEMPRDAEVRVRSQPFDDSFSGFDAQYLMVGMLKMMSKNEAVIMALPQDMSPSALLQR